MCALEVEGEKKAPEPLQEEERAKGKETPQGCFEPWQAKPRG